MRAWVVVVRELCVISNDIASGGDPVSDPHEVVDHEAALKSSKGFPLW